MDPYTRGYNAGYRAGLRHKEGKPVPPIVELQEKVGPRVVTHHQLYDIMVKGAAERGGYMFEGLRPRFERGEVHDAEIAELLRLGWIVPHANPMKGWVPVPKSPGTPSNKPAPSPHPANPDAPDQP